MTAEETFLDRCTIDLSPEGHEKKRKGVLSGGLIESDSVAFEDNTDRTTEHSRHILFGDHHDEDYRLATFSRFPPYAPVKVYDLARAGFFCLGDRDRVECFSCGIKVGNWGISDNGLSPTLHATNCDMAHGRATLNVARPTREVYDLMHCIASVFQMNQENVSDENREVTEQKQRVGDEEENDPLTPQVESEVAAANAENEEFEENNDDRNENRDPSSRKSSSSRRGSIESGTEEAPAKRHRRPSADQDPDQA